MFNRRICDYGDEKGYLIFRQNRNYYLYKKAFGSYMAKI
jgi:hypothetical protein